MSRVLKLSDHALKRWVETRPPFLSFIPIRPDEVLDLDGAKRLRVVVKSLLKSLTNTVRVQVPDRARFWKWMKHGRTDEIYLWHSPQSTLFTIVPDPDEDVMVTAPRIPTERRTLLVPEETLTDATGAGYLARIGSVRVAYSWRSPEYRPEVSVLGRMVPILSCQTRV